MTTEAVKSAAITNLDASPPVRVTTGRGVQGMCRIVDGSAAVTSGVLSTSTYQLCRVASNVKVKSVQAWLDAAGTTITGDLGMYYSTADDGTPAASRGTAVNSTSGSQLFGTALTLAAIIEPTEFSGDSGNFTGAKRVMPLWEACGLTVDPGGYFDLVFTLTATAGSAAVVNGQMFFVD